MASEQQTSEQNGPTVLRDKGDPAAAARRSLALGRIPVHVQVILGCVTMSIADVSALGPGEIVRLDRKIGEPVDILVNGRLFGRGDIAVLEGDAPRFAISVTEIVEASNDTAA